MGDDLEAGQNVRRIPKLALKHTVPPKGGILRPSGSYSPGGAWIGTFALVRPSRTNGMTGAYLYMDEVCACGWEL